MLIKKKKNTSEDIAAVLLGFQTPNLYTHQHSC